MIRRILLVCTGNTCRSPMAEAMLREMARQRQVELEVRSAGVAALDGQPISEYAAETLRKRNVPLPTGGASSLKEDGAGWADLILTMTVRHKQMLLARFPQAAGKTYTLKEYAYWHATSDGPAAETGGGDGSAAAAAAEPPDLDIADPFGGSLREYEQSADEISRALERVLDRLVASGAAAPVGAQAGAGAAGEAVAVADAADAKAAGDPAAGTGSAGDGTAGEGAAGTGAPEGVAGQGPEGAATD